MEFQKYVKDLSGKWNEELLDRFDGSLEPFGRDGNRVNPITHC